MSHVAKLTTKITNLAALQMACDQLELTMRTGKTYTYEDRSTMHDAEYVISDPAARHSSHGYAPREIGVVPEGDIFRLAMSPMSGGICQKVGDPLYQEGGQSLLAPKLMERYAMCTAALAAREQGANIRFFEENGVQKAEVTQAVYA